jgi:poly(3-hydroxybutyrate) depolymerase
VRFSRLVVILGTIAALCHAGLATAASHRLPALGADPARTSVSGLSSGAFMAFQYGVAFSASTIGMGIVAGGPYNCAYVNPGGIVTCMSGSPDGPVSYSAAKDFAKLGQIDPVSNLVNEKIYMFSGTNDTKVKQTVMNAVFDFFQAAHVPSANIEYVTQYPAGHAFISPTSTHDCAATTTPYVDACPVTDAPDGVPSAVPSGARNEVPRPVPSTAPSANYDQPDAILARIYGPLQPKAATLSSRPIPFDQTEFISPVRSAKSSMADTGYVYIPASCAKRGPAHCAVHVVFHGCEQGAQTVHDAVYGKVGYNNWADSNNVIVLYPQAEVSDFIPFNPKGCWDWWGYSGLDFQVQSGVQLAAVRAMVTRLTTPPK